jgi:large subunit ribosomal protein L25
VEQTAIVAQYREGTGKGFARRLRAAGRMPAILYRGGRETIPLTLDPRLLRRLLTASHAGMNTLIDLSVEGRPDIGERVVLVKELQRDPVRGTFLHADFYEVDLTKKVHVMVPIHLKGSAQGVLMGGVIDHNLREMEVECLPRAIPDEFVLDVSSLGIGDSLHVRDIELPAGVTLRTASDADLSVVSVMLPAVEEEKPAAEAVAVEGAEAAPGEAAPGEAGEAKAEEED